MGVRLHFGFIVFQFPDLVPDFFLVFFQDLDVSLCHGAIQLGLFDLQFFLVDLNDLLIYISLHPISVAVNTLFGFQVILFIDFLGRWRTVWFQEGKLVVQVLHVQLTVDLNVP